MVDSRERYGYTFADRQVEVSRRRLDAGDHAVEHAGAVIAAVERKSLDDLVSSLTGGRLRFQLAELAALPHAAVVVEERYSTVRWPSLPSGRHLSSTAWPSARCGGRRCR